MKTAIALIAACAFLTGCVVVPSSACELLEIAHEEAQLARHHPGRAAVPVGLCQGRAGVIARADPPTIF